MLILLIYEIVEGIKGFFKPKPNDFFKVGDIVKLTKDCAKARGEEYGTSHLVKDVKILKVENRNEALYSLNGVIESMFHYEIERY